VKNTKSLATVATSGAYSDLSGTPEEYALPAATSSALGGVMLGHSSTVTAPASYTPADTSANFTLMPLQLDSNGKAVIGVSRQYYKYITLTNAEFVGGRSGLQNALANKNVYPGESFGFSVVGIMSRFGFYEPGGNITGFVYSRTISLESSDRYGDYMPVSDTAFDCRFAHFAVTGGGLTMSCWRNPSAATDPVVTAGEISGADANRRIVTGAILKGLQTTSVVGTSSSLASNASTGNTNTYLNIVEGGVVKSSHKITGSGGATVSSDGSGNITFNANQADQAAYEHPELINCSDLIRDSHFAYDFNGHYASDQEEFFSCTCDPTNNYADFSLRIKIAGSQDGTFITKGYTGGSYPTMAMSINGSVPFDGLMFLLNPGIYPAQDHSGDKNIVCDVEATGLHHGFAFDDNSGGITINNCFDFNSFGSRDEYYDKCATIVSGVAIWSASNRAVFINFGQERWGPGGENTIFLHCSGKVNECPA
jgi:hypothetical protein